MKRTYLTHRMIKCGAALLAFLFIFASAPHAQGSPRLSLQQIVQREGEFTLYVNSLDADNRSAGAEADPGLYTIQMNALAPVAPDSVTPFEQTGQGIAYIVAADVSGSVTQKEMEQMIAALEDFVDQLRPEDTVRLMTIGNQVTQVVGPTGDRSALRQAVKASIHRKDKKTFLYQGLCQALDSTSARSLDGPTRQALVVFTDGGDDSDGVWDAQAVLDRMEDARLPVYAVALTGNAKASPTAVERLCIDSGGAMLRAEGGTVADALNDILSIIRGTVVLSVSPQDPAWFGVMDGKWRLAYRGASLEVRSNTYPLTTQPTLPPLLADDNVISSPVPVVTFKDPSMEGAVRRALGKSSGDIMPDDLLPLSELSLEGVKLQTLDDLKQLTGLLRLTLNRCTFADPSPLAELTALKELTIVDCELRDASALRGLTKLTALNLSDNKGIKDLTPLSGLKELRKLDLSDNQIADVSVLGGLTALKTLNLARNSISDTAPLRPLDQAGCSIDLKGNIKEGIDPLPTPPQENTAVKWFKENTVLAYIILGGVLLLVIVAAIRQVRRARHQNAENAPVAPAPLQLDHLRTDDLIQLGKTRLTLLAFTEDYGGAPSIDSTIDLSQAYSGSPRSLNETISLGPEDHNPHRQEGLRILEECEGRTAEYEVSLRHLPLVIGKSEECALRLTDPSVSRRHARIVMRADQYYYIEDLGSRNGTRLNGRAVLPVGEVS